TIEEEPNMNQESQLSEVFTSSSQQYPSSSASMPESSQIKPLVGPIIGTMLIDINEDNDPGTGKQKKGKYQQAYLKVCNTFTISLLAIDMTEISLFKSAIYIHLLGLRAATYYKTGQWDAPISKPKQKCMENNFVIQCAEPTSEHNREVCNVLATHFTSFLEANIWKKEMIGRSDGRLSLRIRSICEECLNLQISLQKSVKREGSHDLEVQQYDLERRLARRVAKSPLTQLVIEGGADMCSSDESGDDDTSKGKQKHGKSDGTGARRTRYVLVSVNSLPAFGYKSLQLLINFLPTTFHQIYRVSHNSATIPIKLQGLLIFVQSTSRPCDHALTAQQLLFLRVAPTCAAAQLRVAEVLSGWPRGTATPTPQAGPRLSSIMRTSVAAEPAAETPKEELSHSIDGTSKAAVADATEANGKVKCRAPGKWFLFVP
ncbi:12523_t:CDS:10, partial [Acaulospora colombiana]